MGQTILLGVQKESHRMKKKFIFIFTTISIFVVLSCGNPHVWDYKTGLTDHWSEYYYEYGEDNNPDLVDNKLLFACASKQVTEHINTNYYHGGFYLLDKDTGTKEWELSPFRTQYTTFITGIAPFTTDGELVFIRQANYTTVREELKGNNTTFLCLDINSGRIQWKFNFYRIFDSFLLCDSSILLSVYEHDQHSVLAFNKKTGSILWKQDTSMFMGFRGTYDRTNNIAAFPSLYQMLLLEASSGEVYDDISLSDCGYLVSSQGIIVAQGNKNKKFNEQEGYFGYAIEVKKIIWEIPDIEWRVYWPKPVIHEEMVYIFNPEYLIAFELKTGKILWKIKNIQDEDFTVILSKPVQAVQIVGDYLYWPLLDHKKIYKYNPETGKLLEKITLNHPIHSGFCYSDGVIYYRSEDMVYAEEVEL